MNIRQKLVNLVGDFLGIVRCPLTGDSLYSGFFSVNYTDSRGLLVSINVQGTPLDEIARRVYEFVVKDGRIGADETSPERIVRLNSGWLSMFKPSPLSRGGIKIYSESVKLIEQVGSDK